MMNEKDILDYAYEHYNLETYPDQGGDSIPEHLLNYIDWEAMGKDWVYGGDIYMSEQGYKSVFVFRNN